MPDSDQSLDIVIKLLAQTQGAEQVQAALNKVKGSAGGMGEQLQETGKQGEKSAAGLLESHHALHHLLDSIGNTAVPGMGRAFGALAMGPLGAIVALASAVEIVKHHLDDVNAKLDETAAKASEAFGDRWQAARDASREVAEAADKFNQALKQSADSTDTIKRNMDDSKGLIGAQTKALQEQLKAREQLELAQAGGDKQKEEQIRQKYHDLETGLSAGERKENINAQKQAAYDARNAQPGLDADAEAKRAATLTPLTDVKDIQSEIKSLEDDRANIKTNAAKNDADIDAKIDGIFATLKNRAAATGTTLEEQKKLDPELAAKIPELQSQLSPTQLAAIDAKIKTLDRQLVEHQQKADAATAAAGEAEKRASENKSFYEGIQKTVPGQEKQNAVPEKGESNARALEHIALITKNGEEGNAYLKDMLQAVGFTSNATTRILKDILNHHIKQKDVLADIHHRVHALEHETDNIGARTDRATY